MARNFRTKKLDVITIPREVVAVHVFYAQIYKQAGQVKER